MQNVKKSNAYAQNGTKRKYNNESKMKVEMLRVDLKRSKTTICKYKYNGTEN